MEFFPAQYYFSVHLHIVLIWCVYVWTRYGNVDVDELLYQRKSYIGILLYTALFIIVLGLRPISGRLFGDTSNYALIYKLIQQTEINIVQEGEWLWNALMQTCAQVMNVHGFFLIVELGYVGLMFWTCKRLMDNNVTIAMLFCIGAFSFFTYGMNGIRNGLACSIILLAFSFITGNKRDKIIAAVLCFCAYNIHHSTALPILCMLVSLFYHNTKAIYAFWFISIVISAVAGGAIGNLFAGLGFDDRLDSYLQNDRSDLFSHTGFRWDFLLYSAMPLWLGWHVVIRQDIKDENYLMLLHSYILCNAFWIMVIHASYSNRFAYLSWFLYPIVLAYPLLRLPIWENQGKITGTILMAHILFTYLMWLLR